MRKIIKLINMSRNKFNGGRYHNNINLLNKTDYSNISKNKISRHIISLINLFIQVSFPMFLFILGGIFGWGVAQLIITL